MSQVQRASFARNPFLTCGVIFALSTVLLGLFSPIIGPYSPVEQQLRMRHIAPLSSGTAVDRTTDPPSEHQRFFVLGTDHLGRDYLSRYLASLKTSAYSGLLAWVLGTGLAWLLITLQGGTSKVALKSMRFPLNILCASPLVLCGLVLGLGNLIFWIYITITLRVLEVGPQPINTIFFPSILAALLPASILYKSVLEKASTRENIPSEDGSPHWAIIRQGLLLAPLSLSLAVLVSMLFEVFPWSFLGFGVQPPEATLGLMLSQGRQYIVTAPWVVQVPAVTLLLAIGALLAITLPMTVFRRLPEVADHQAIDTKATVVNASSWSRIGSFALDFLLLWLLKEVWGNLPFWAVIFIFSFYSDLNPQWSQWFFTVFPKYYLVSWAIYFPLFWATSGQTPGMRIFDIKVVRVDGTRLTMARAALRLIGLVVSGAVLFLGFIWILFNAKKQGWHDQIADTQVIRSDLT